MQTSIWDNKFADRTKKITSSAIRELLKMASRPEVISFGGGMPAPDLFPREQILAACERVLKDPALANQALQYSTTEGHPPLREWIADFMSQDGLKVNPDNILITGGSQQALDMIGKVFINEGDKVVVESPTYLGALQAWASYGTEYAIVPSDNDGMKSDGLSAFLEKNPKFIYVLSNFQNPTGATIPLERRQKLVELSTQYGVPIVEDDPYGALIFEGQRIPLITALESQYQHPSKSEASNVVYLSTFSKILTPGLRLAWVVAPSRVIGKLVQAKQGMDLHTTTFSQFVAYEVARTGMIKRHIERLIELYRHRRDVMLECLEENMPQSKGISWTHPRGGLFLWVTLPLHLDSAAVLERSIKENVAFVPGESFHPGGGGRNTMRLNFSYTPDEKICEGIGRLGKVVKQMV
jgi:2-aminoadipate transaminase